MGERWETTEQVDAARVRFEAAIPGWCAPAAYGVGRLVCGRVEFARVNVGQHGLPAVVLATVCGHRTGSGSYWLDAAGLSRAIELLAPAEACLEYEHPNLAVWRWLHADLGEGERVVAVFAADPDGVCNDPYVAALRERLCTGRVEN